MASFQKNVESRKVMGLIQCPSDVLELIISFLPVADMFRLRTVCKRLNKVVTTRAFQENGQLRYKKLELLAVCNVGSDSNKPEFKAYDVKSQKWYLFNLSFLPDIGGFRVVDFAGGLACVTQMGDMRRGLYVCNPLTKKWARLPSPPISINSSSAHVIVKMYYCRKTGHYKVFVVSGLCMNPGHKHLLYSHLVAEEFDSCTWTWAVYSQTCHPFRWCDVRGIDILPCTGNGVSLLILLYSSRIFSSNPGERQLFALLFDEDKGGLGLVKIGAPLPTYLLNPTMVCCEQNPHPLLVFTVGRLGVEIWELGNQLTEWRNLAYMPSDLFMSLKGHHKQAFIKRRKLERKNFQFTTVVAAADKHVIHIRPKNVLSLEIAYDTMIYYDTVKRSWTWPGTNLFLRRSITASFLPPMNATEFSPETIAPSCVRECAFEPSLENVVSPIHMEF